MRVESITLEGLHDFHQVAWAVYQDDPRWIPEDRGSLVGLMEPGHGVRTAAWCVPERSRVAAFLHDGPIEGVADRTCFFGLWESVGNLDADRLTFDALRSWARAHGAKHLLGPINRTTFAGYRILTEVRGEPSPTLAEPYNPLWYSERLHTLGFRRVGPGYFTFVLDPEQQTAVVELAQEGEHQFLSHGFTFEPMTEAIWIENLDTFGDMVMSVFSRQFAFTPIDHDTFVRHHGATFIRRIIPECSIASRAPNGELAGFFLSYPDYGPICSLGAGESRVALGALNAREDIPRLQTTGHARWVGRTGGIREEYRGLGVLAAAYSWVIRHALENTLWGDAWWGIGTDGKGPERVFRQLLDAHPSGPVDRQVRRYGLFGTDL
ncbi:MAG: hypothetical protein KAZ88_07530 [Acidimicrobiia bacterium]|nr:hypothetical protein [Acidimicrobiia bacterium]